MRKTKIKQTIIIVDILITLAIEQEVAHVEAEGARHVATPIQEVT